MEPKLILTIETAVEGGSIALLSDASEITSLSGNQDISRAEELIPHIRSMLEMIGVEIDQIDKVGVSIGPGSYTGIRIGIATALGLKGAWGVEVVGISVLEAIAAQYSNGSMIVSAVPIGNKDVAWQEFQIGADVVFRGEPRIDSFANFAEWLKQHPEKIAAVYSTLYDKLSVVSHSHSSRASLIRTGSNLALYVGKAVANGLGTIDLTALYLLNPERSRGLF